MEKQRTRIQIIKGLSQKEADPLSDARGFLLLKNARVDDRLGAVVKREGSLEETITTSLGVPVGVGELLEGLGDELLPVSRKVLVNFAGSNFYSLESGTWGSESLSSHVSFGTSRSSQMAQLGGKLFIAAGRPAQWDGTNAIDMVGIEAPAAAITHTVSGTGITGSFLYMYTYYNSTTGLESDWSPLSATASPSNQQVNLTIPTTASTGTSDKVRIYRTTDGGSLFYLLQTQDIATGTYTDTTSDATLLGNAQSSDQGDHGLPPSNSYICAAFAAHVWWVDATNPTDLYYSKPYIGSDITTEYVPSTNVVRFDEPITGLLKTPGRLLVVHPRNISAITGSSSADFQREPFIQGVGTLFPNSIATNGKWVVMLGEEGYVGIGAEGRQVVSEPIHPDLQVLLRTKFNSALYVSTVWCRSLKQFIFCFSGTSSEGAPWEVVGSGAVAEWENASTMATEEWEDASAPSTETLRRVKFWGWNPDFAQVWSEYEFAYATDRNDAGAYASFVFQPHPDSSQLAPQEERLLIGFYDGTDGAVVGAFRSDRSTDSGTNITAEAMTGRIAPGDDDESFKLFRTITLKGDYADAAANSGTLQYLKDIDDPHLNYSPSDLLSFQDDTTRDRKKFTSPKARWIHLYVKDSTSNAGNIMLSDFVIEHRERYAREGR